MSREIRVEVPVEFGTDVAIWIQLMSVAEGSVSENTYQANSDFSQTLQIQSIQLVDLNGAPIANPSLVAASGTVYPLLGVPEPGTAWLLATALLTMCARKCRV